jgi:hypothetical protein
MAGIICPNGRWALKFSILAEQRADRQEAREQLKTLPVGDFGLSCKATSPLSMAVEDSSTSVIERAATAR